MFRKVVSVYSIIVGISMIALWTMFYLSGNIPELNTEPARILMHITAEIATGLALVIGGYGMLTLKKWGYNLYLISTGALIYTLIQSPGYYLHHGVPAFVIMFAVMLILTLILLVGSIKRKLPASS